MANKPEKAILAAPYRRFLHNYAKELYEIDAPMIAGAIERCIQKLDKQPAVNQNKDETAHWIWNDEDQCWICSSCGASALNNYAGHSTDSRFCPDCGKSMISKAGATPIQYKEYRIYPNDDNTRFTIYHESDHVAAAAIEDSLQAAYDYINSKPAVIPTFEKKE